LATFFEIKNVGRINNCSKYFGIGKRPHRLHVTPHGGKWIRLILTASSTWFLGPTLVRPKGHLDRLSRFTQLTRVPNTQTHRPQTTLRATFGAIGHIYALHAGDAA